jgi:hypothetical protein
MRLRFSVAGACLALACICGFGQSVNASDRLSSDQTVCRPRMVATPKLLSAGVRVLRTTRGLGTCPRGIRPTATGRRGTLWATDTFNGLWKSSDDGKTWHLAYTATAYHNVERVLQLRSGRILIVVADNKGRRHILRSSDSSGTKFGRPVMNFPFDPTVDNQETAPRLLGSQSWTQAPDGAIYVGEYGFAVLNGIKLWKSTNDGKSFRVAATWSDVKHIHSVYADPYSRNKLWVAIGDTGRQPRIGYSTDGGANFTYVSRGLYPQSRAVGLLFTRNAVLWATDSPEVPAGFFRWDRASGQVSRLLAGLNGPFYYTAQFRNAYVQFSTVSLKSNDGYIGDEYIHVVSSKNGSSWSSTKTPWMRARQPLDKATILGITRPDSHGRFWVSFYDLAGATTASGRTTAVELQLK